MKQILVFFLLIGNCYQSFGADSQYWTFSSNSNTKKTTECVKMKESEFQSMIKAMGCVKVFASGILFCSEKRVVYLYPDEKQCVAHQKMIKL